ncbi:MAG: protein-methionine-sulfoxide reductase catalytic subunit MsrP [Pseudoxanthomonas suwonensis]|nr:MAG: protein-methionine-sulfoxide reductase catalytic subunit MsrP [Pseudoxanthomonas suwonensis]
MTLRDVLRIPDHAVTDEAVYRQRRRLLGAAIAGPLLGSLSGCSEAAPPPSRKPVSARQARSAFRTDEELTTWQDATTYNNFYEFGSDKRDPGQAARTLRITPWSVVVGGECENPGRIGLDDLVKGITSEERIYRLRCVEGWSMVLPWQGVPLAAVLQRFKPTSKAKYVAFTTLADPQQMPGVRTATLDWPYREGLRIDEAMHPLSFLATGLYSKPLPQQNGAPLRLVVPWKYGFKSIKSIVAIGFHQRMPVSTWNELQPREYGFFSNVNPAVDHPRWSQKTERRIAGNANKLFANRIPTLPFNGYGEQVAGLYAGMDLRKWF